MVEYLCNALNLIAPYVKLSITLVFLWATMVNWMSYRVKIKYSNSITDADITNVATAVVLLILSIFIFYIM